MYNCSIAWLFNCSFVQLLDCSITQSESAPQGFSHQDGKQIKCIIWGQVCRQVNFSRSLTLFFKKKKKEFYQHLFCFASISWLPSFSCKCLQSWLLLTSSANQLITYNHMKSSFTSFLQEQLSWTITKYMSWICGGALIEFEYDLFVPSF